LIQGIKNQLRLKPRYYRQVSYVGGFGCFIGIAIFSFSFDVLIQSLGLGLNAPIRQMDTVTLVVGLTTMFIGFVLLVLVSASLLCLIFYGVKSLDGSINFAEVIDISLKGKYPQSWYKDV
jgi:hypothetical protein